MKKTALLALSLALCFTLMACGNENETESPEAGQTTGNGEAAATPAPETPEVGASSAIPENLSAADVASEMGVGWNLGNAFDAWQEQPGIYRDATAEEIPFIETAWVGGPEFAATESLMRKVADLGFQTIRIPTHWAKMADPDDDWRINAHWMARVKEVVGWAYDAGLYVILNDHHQENALDMSSGDAATGIKYLTDVWTQIAYELEEFGERLIFEGMNEPRARLANGDDWGGNAELRAIINQYNQAFVDAVRSTGGNNAQRILMIPAYSASNNISDFVVPDDLTTSVNKLIWSVHSYDPFGWAHDGAGTYSGSGGIGLKSIAENAGILGLPAVIGEWGSIENATGGFSADDIPANIERQERRNELRIDHASDFVTLATELGLVPVWWDNSGFNAESELNESLGVYTGDHKFGLIGREAPHYVAARHLAIIDAMMTSAGQALSEPFINVEVDFSVPGGLVEGSISGELRLSAEVARGTAQPSIQWYSNTARSNEGGSPISGATDSVFAIPGDLAEGEHFFYAVVSAGDIPAVATRVAAVSVSGFALTDIGPGRDPSYVCDCTTFYDVRLPIHGGNPNVTFDITADDSLVEGQVCCDKIYTFKRTFEPDRTSLDVLHVAVNMGATATPGLDADILDKLIVIVHDVNVNGATPDNFNSQVFDRNRERSAFYEVSLFNSWHLGTENVWGLDAGPLEIEPGSYVEVTVEFRGLPCGGCGQEGCMTCFPPSR